jgi:CheY-like chemotaxis protein
MQKIDGFGFLESLQKNGIRGNTPIIVATNSGEKGDIEKAVSMGANDYVVKSDMSMKGLIEKIEKHLAIAQKNAQANPQVQTGS